MKILVTGSQGLIGSQLVTALNDHGHTVLVIEHNLDFIWASDYVIDLGPGSGDAGGELVATGSPEQLLHQVERSATARALLKERQAEARLCQ